MSHSNDRFDLIKDGEERIFAFLQVDIAKHGQLKGPSILLQQTKSNLGYHLRSIVENFYSGRQLNWAGDGGAFLFLIENPSQDYDRAVIAAIHILMSMPFFNAMVQDFNVLGEPLALRVTCHEGRANWHQDPGFMHSTAINYFLKYERLIGLTDTVAITEDIYDQLVRPTLKTMFEKSSQHEYLVAGKQYTKAVYSLRRDYTTPGLTVVPTLTEYRPAGSAYRQGAITQDLLHDVATLIEDAGPHRLDIVTLVGTSFFDNPDFRRLLALHREINVRILLLSPDAPCVPILDDDLRVFLGETGSVSDWISRSLANAEQLRKTHGAKIEYRFLNDPPPWKLIAAIGGSRVAVSCRLYGRGRGGYGPMLRFVDNRQALEEQISNKNLEPGIGTLLVEDFELRWAISDSSKHE